MTSQLFAPLRIGGLELPNRITVAPMCQYSAVDSARWRFPARRCW